MLNKVQNFQIIWVMLCRGFGFGQGGASVGGHSMFEVEVSFKSESDPAHSYSCNSVGTAMPFVSQTLEQPVVQGSEP